MSTLRANQFETDRFDLLNEDRVCVTDFRFGHNRHGHYYFLDRNDCGFWLHGSGFSGAETFFGDESVKIQKWLADHAN